MKNLKIATFQMNTVSGDIEGNYKKAKKFIEESVKSNADFIVLPETAISGYAIGSLWENIDFIKEQEEKTLELVNIVPPDKCLVIGYASFWGIKKNGYPRIKNSALISNNGKIHRYDKQYLAGDNHQEDKKYFEEGDESLVFDIKLKNQNIKIGTPICEDIWYIDHSRDIPKEMVDMGAEFLISINQSYFYYGKQKIRENLINRFENISFLYLNSCGVGDIVKNIIIFDGGSLFWNGKNMNSFPRFKEYDAILETISLIKVDNYKDKYDEIIEALIFEQKELFKLCGISNAQVHLSGGLDSSIVAYLVAKSMGKENTVFITNPSDLSSDSINFARHTAKKLDIKLWENPIQEIYDKILEVDEKSFEGMDLNPVGKSTIQAVLRTCLGLYNAHRFKSGLVSCGNHTEIVLGWANFHDLTNAAVHAIIGDLTKIELFELSEHINKKENDIIIPEELYNGKIKPMAELPDVGKKEDPIDYVIDSPICATMIRDNKSKKGLINDYINNNLNSEYFNDDIYNKYPYDEFIKHVEFCYKKAKISVFKAVQGPPIVILNSRSRGFSNRETIINKYNG